MKIGDKVVCINDKPCRWCGASLPINAGRVYVISSLVQDEPSADKVNLIGIKQARCHYTPFIIAFGADRFRLLDEVKASNKLIEEVTDKLCEIYLK